MKNVIVSMVALAGIAAGASAQVTQLPIGATLRYQVFDAATGQWAQKVDVLPGTTVEWRTVVSYTGSEAVQALGQIYYQPIIGGADNTDAGDGLDTLGGFRNNGNSGIGNAGLLAGMLNAGEANTGAALASYGRVSYGFTSRSTTFTTTLTSFRHTGGSGGAPATTDYIRIASANNPNWYPSSIPVGSAALNNQILNGVVSDSPAANNTNWIGGSSGLTIFRQAITLSNNENVRELSITSEASTLRRAGGAAGTDDTRFMSWQLVGDASNLGSLRVGVEYIPAFINVVPTPASAALLGLGGLIAARRRRA